MLYGKGALANFVPTRPTLRETWTFLRYAFLPYEDGLTLFVRSPDGRENEVRLQWRPESQGAVIDALDGYVTPAPR